MPDETEQTPRTYADLLAIWETAEPWQPPSSDDSPAPSSNGKPTDKEVDLFTDRQIADALQVDVLGTHEDGTVEVYSVNLRRTVYFKGVDRLKYPEMLRLFGTPVRKCVSKTNEDAAPGMFPISDVREAIGHLASQQMIQDQTKLGPGCWPIQNEGQEGQDELSVILVNSHEATHYNGNTQRILHPRYCGHLLSFESGAPEWFEHDSLCEMVEKARDVGWRSGVADELIDILRRWRWQSKNDPLIVTGLVFSTWVQSVWDWRPRIDILGASGSGKSMLCEMLSGLFRDLVISTADTSFAGLAQEMQRQMAAVIVDEVDAKDRASRARQREIIKGLRSASRGTVRIRGTGGQRATKFALRHLPWVAGISMDYEDQADRNRAVILQLQKPEKSKEGKLVLPPQTRLREIGQKSLAVAIVCCREARKIASSLKDQQIENVDPRQIESYAVPAAMVACVMGFDAAQAPDILAGVLSDVQLQVKLETDEERLIAEILSASIQLQNYRLNVGQVIEIVCNPVANDREGWGEILSSAGIQVNLATDELVVRYQGAQQKLLRGTKWEGQSIDIFLRRIDNATTTQRRVGGSRGRCVIYPLGWFRKTFIGDNDEETTNTNGF